MKSKEPSIEDLLRAHEAESKKISDLIEQGYDFEKEMGKSPLKQLLGDDYREIMERNRKAAKRKDKK